MKTRNMILILSIILCVILVFATPVLADGGPTEDENTVYIQDQSKNNTAIEQNQKTDLPNTGSTENYIFIGLVITSVVIAIYSYKKMIDYKEL